MDGMFSMLGEGGGGGGGPGGPNHPPPSTSRTNGTPSKKDKSKSKKRAAAGVVSASPDVDVDVEGEEDVEPPKKKGKSKASPVVDPMEALDQEPMQVDTPVRASRGEVDHSRNNPALKDKAMPVLADDFEQEAEREVPATTGFAAAAQAEGEKMKLVHQVSSPIPGMNRLYPWPDISLLYPPAPPSRSVIKWHSHQTFHMFPYPPIFPTIHQRKSTHSRWILSNEYQSTPSSEMKVYWYQRIPVQERL
jgi:hypothetical protein